MENKLFTAVQKKYVVPALAVGLYLLSILLNQYRYHTDTANAATRQANNYIAKNENDFNRFLTDTSLLQKLADNTATADELLPVTEEKYALYLYDASFRQLKFWSKQIVLPSTKLLYAIDGEYLETLPNGQYVGIRRTISINSQKTIAIALIPIRSDYFIETDYLPRAFFFGDELEKKVAISTMATSHTVQSSTGNPLFYFVEKPGFATKGGSTISIVLQLISFLLLLYFIYTYTQKIAARKTVWAAIGFLFISVLVLRLLVYFVPWLLRLRQLELFDPAVYGSSALLRSLGDLLINALLFTFVILYAWRRLKTTPVSIDKLSNIRRSLLTIMLLSLLLLVSFFTASIIRSLVADSKISFDVTDFFRLSIYTGFGFLIMALLVVSYYWLTQILLRYIMPVFQKEEIFLYAAMGGLGLAFLLIFNYNNFAGFYLPILSWLLLYTWLSCRRQQFVRRLHTPGSGLLLWVFVFSLSIAAIILSANQNKEWERRKSFAEKLATQVDPSSERLLSIALAYIDIDFLQNNLTRFANADENRKLRDSILTANYRGYLNKYDTKIFVFDSLKRPLNNDESTPYDDLNTLINIQSSPTHIPDVYFYETSFDKFVYITRKQVADSMGKMQSAIFILSNPKSFGSDALLPQLFSKYNQSNLDNSTVYFSAIYTDGALVSPMSKYSFPSFINSRQIPRKEFEKRINGNYTELWYRTTANSVVVLARKKNTFTESVTLFSYVFCSFLLLTIMAWLILFLVKLVKIFPQYKKLFRFSIRRQIHNTIIFISIFSFIIIGISTISFFVSRYNKINTNRLTGTMHTMISEIQRKVADNTALNVEVQISDTAVAAQLNKITADMARIYGINVNVYDLAGNLFISSEANTYSKGVLGKKMDPVAYLQLNQNGLSQFNQKENIGNLTYWSIYAPLQDEGRNIYAYLNIPYFTSQPELNKEISNFLVTIINLNALIILLAGFIALFIANRITRSFAVIRNKMREVRLGKANDEIAITHDDEIGSLVNEYNKMVRKLEESAIALGKSEREGAWREMARQVAHEIKNPLTPMKLSMQYLQKAIDNNQPNVKVLSETVAKTLVEQIDHLSTIAEDFSQFAHIGNRSLTGFDIQTVIASLVQLHAANEKVEIEWQAAAHPINIYGDKTQINRLFTNLILNAIQACEHKEKCRIRIILEVEAYQLSIQINDNGDGISPALQSKIFEPNFTTKSSGTGLGLAMCKGIVEQANGSICFETKEKSGTTFFITLPIDQDAG